MSQTIENSRVEPISYRNDKINAAIGKLRLTNQAVAEKATDILRRSEPSRPPMAPRRVAEIRDGNPNVRLPMLAAVAEAVGLTLHEVFEPTQERDDRTAPLPLAAA